jgi:hypothetical protein
MKKRMIGLVLAAAAAWGSGCTSSEPRAEEPEQVSAIKFVLQETEKAADSSAIKR